MTQTKPIEPIDYLLIGHVTADMQPDGGISLGGTASFSGLTAARLGHRVGLVTSCSPELNLDPLSHLQTWAVPAEKSTTFRNVTHGGNRVQHLFASAARLDANSVPALWQTCPLVHLGPVAAEIDPQIAFIFPKAMLCITPQGWYRQPNAEGLVRHVDWSAGRDLLASAAAVVLSLEDLRGDENKVEEMASFCSLLAVTDSRNGARVFWRGQARHFTAPKVEMVEDTGAGDIFAACFFHRLFTSQDPWEAARFAVLLASNSVTRRRLDSIPTRDEIELARNQTPT